MQYILRRWLARDDMALPSRDSTAQDPRTQQCLVHKRQLGLQFYGRHDHSSQLQLHQVEDVSRLCCYQCSYGAGCLLFLSRNCLS